MAGRPKRIHAHAEWRTHIDFADDRFAHRDGNQRAAVTVDLRARGIDTIELTFKGAGARLWRLDRNEGAAVAPSADARAPSTPRSTSTLCIRRARVSMRSSRLVRVAACFCSTLSRESATRASMPPRPPAVVRSATRVSGACISRDCNRASRSGGAEKITVSLIGEGRTGLSADVEAGGATRAGLDCAGREAVAGECRGALLQRRLPLEQRVELFLELFLVEQLATHDAIDLRAQFGDTVLIGKLHLGLPSDQAGEDIVAEREIAAGRDRPGRHHHKRANHDPECDRSDADLVSGVRERVAILAAVEMPGDRGGRMRMHVGLATRLVRGRVIRKTVMMMNTTSTFHAPAVHLADINPIWLRNP